MVSAVTKGISTGFTAFVGFLKKNPQMARILLIIAIILVIYYVGKKKGMAGNGKSKWIKKWQLPDSGSGIPQGWSPSPLAQEVHDMLNRGPKGRNIWLKPNKETFKKLYELPTDDMFIAVNIDFNNRFAKGGGTMHEQIKEEYYVDSLFSSMNYKELVLDRLEKLAI